MMKSELLAPAGNLDSAMAAFENGADAVYCGLQEFSARKGAKNFSLEQISRLREWTERNDKKLYITLNTILREDELPRMLGYLYRLEELQVDSIILQDPGLARIIKNHFPGLVLHGSTQMAVHNIQGLEILREMGFTRVVLPREMTMDEMALFRNSLPEMELEVFIHGAQCYGFSGMCLASGMLLGRSANRGECGQICRTWFNRESERGYFLSSTDLWAGSKVLKLQSLGIHSLKIEGRMKSPAYAAAVSRYYRAILDGCDRESLKALEEDLQIAFSRRAGSGHLESRKGQTMVDSEFTGHRGLPLGELSESRGRQITLHSRADLHKRDGLMFLDKNREARSFSLDLKKSMPAGKMKLTLPFPAPPEGTVLYKVQSHNFHSRSFNENSLPLRRRSVQGSLTISRDSGELQIPEIGFRKTYPLPSEPSTGKLGPEEKIRKEFSKNGSYTFLLNNLHIAAGEQEGNRLFIPPSGLKKMRQQAYRDVETCLRQGETDRLEGIRRTLKSEARLLEEFLVPLPGRSSLNPGESQLPVIIPGETGHIRPARREGRSYLPLTPLLFPSDEQHYSGELAERINRDNAEQWLGINNWGHIRMFRGLEKKTEEPLKCYGDTGMLLANSQSVLLMRDLLGSGFSAAYDWIESKDSVLSSLSVPGRDFKPPLFISRNCFKKHSLSESCTGCSRDMEYTLSQNNRSYRVIVRNCLSWVFAADADQN